jgi:hypothetical protein
MNIVLELFNTLLKENLSLNQIVKDEKKFVKIASPMVERILHNIKGKHKFNSIS